MSGGSVRRACLVELSAVRPTPDLEEHLVVLLDECPESFLQFVYDLAAAAPAVDHRGLQRAAAVVFLHLAIELADDLADDECPKAIDPKRDAAVLLLVLQTLFFRAALDAGVSPKTLCDVAHELIATAGAQYEEVRRTTWSEEASTRVARALNGQRYGAYLEVLWAGTPRAPDARAWGRELGFALHILGDASTGDRRYLDNSPTDRARLLASAEAAAKTLASSDAMVFRALAAKLDGVVAALTS